MSEFDKWLVENYGFHPDMRPVRNDPPNFVKQDGIFDTKRYVAWKDTLYNTDFRTVKLKSETVS